MLATTRNGICNGQLEGRLGLYKITLPHFIENFNSQLWIGGISSFAVQNHQLECCFVGADPLLYHLRVDG